MDKQRVVKELAGGDFQMKALFNSMGDTIDSLKKTMDVADKYGFGDIYRELAKVRKGLEEIHKGLV